MSHYSVVDTEAALSALATKLAHEPRLFIDTEFESTRQGTRLCLLQISAEAGIFLVDAVRVQDLRPLRALFQDEEKEWVLHAAQQDIPLLEGTFGLRAHRRIFDTQLAWALLGPEFSVSLSYLVFRVLGKRSAKAHQADDWTRRPLPVSQLDYAAADVESLPALYENMATRLRALGRLDVLHEVVAEQLRSSDDRYEQLELNSFRNAWQLGGTQQAVLKYLILWFNELSDRERRRAPEAKTLLSIAMRAPGTTRDLARIKGVPQRWCVEHGYELVEGIREAGRAAQLDAFEPIAPPPYATFEGIRFDAWLQTLRAEISAELQIAPELAFPSRILRRLQQAITRGGTEDIPGAVLRGWRAAIIAPSLSAYLKQHPAPH